MKHYWTDGQTGLWRDETVADYDCCDHLVGGRQEGDEVHDHPPHDVVVEQPGLHCPQHRAQLLHHSGELSAKGVNERDRVSRPVYNIVILFHEISLIEALLSVNAHLEVGERVADHLVLGGEGARPDGVEEGHPVKVGHRLHQLGHRHLRVPLASVVPGV